MSLKLGFIGAGRAATALAWRFHALGYPISGVSSRQPEKARALAIPLGAAYDIFPPPGDLLFVAVPDGAMMGVAHSLAEAGVSVPVVHLSGVHGLEALAPLPLRGSFHPMYPFREGTRLRGDEKMLIGIEAETPALAETLINLAQALGGRPALLKTGEKAKYHAAAVIASNYLVTLFALALDLLGQAGVPPDLAREALPPLMAGNLENLATLPPAQALTGPIARGDVETLQKHLTALADTPYGAVYRTLGQLTVALAPHLEDNTRQALLDLLYFPPA